MSCLDFDDGDLQTSALHGFSSKASMCTTSLKKYYFHTKSKKVVIVLVTNNEHLHKLTHCTHHSKTFEGRNNHCENETNFAAHETSVSFYDSELCVNVSSVQH